MYRKFTQRKMMKYKIRISPELKAFLIIVSGFTFFLSTSYYFGNNHLSNPIHRSIDGIIIILKPMFLFLVIGAFFSLVFYIFSIIKKNIKITKKITKDELIKSFNNGDIIYGKNYGICKFYYWVITKDGFERIDSKLNTLVSIEFKELLQDKETKIKVNN